MRALEDPEFAGAELWHQILKNEERKCERSEFFAGQVLVQLFKKQILVEKVIDVFS